MGKSNNFLTAPGSDSPMRFNNRPRYGGNSRGGNNSPRYRHLNQSGIQYSPNRNNATDCSKPNQYENTSNRNFHGNSRKRLNYNQQQNKQSSPYSHKSTISTSLSPSKFSASIQNVLNLPPHINTLSAQTAPATIVAQNNQNQQQPFTSNIMSSSNFYGLGCNFYPNSYNADLFAITSNTLGAADGMSQYMWQTITSTPPPKAHQQPPLSHQQPPLPRQQPPSVLPPLPPSSDNVPHLPPPPPIPVSITDLQPATMTSEKPDPKNNQYLGGRTIVKMKTKRKAMSQRYKSVKSWSENNARMALKAEETNTKILKKDVILIIRFPDPEISREIVKGYSPAIESVHFQFNFAPRCCLVHLKPGVDAEKTIDEISKISFGTGYLSVEMKQIPHKVHSTKLNEVDPFTLYVGNLPTTIACKTLKEHFPGAARIDIGFAQRMKYTRYAFIRYQSVQKAIEAYNRMLGAEIDGRSLTIRFRRLTAANKDGEDDNNDDINDDLLCQTTVASDVFKPLSQNISEDMEPKNGHNANDLPIVTEKHANEPVENTDETLSQENCSTETNLIQPNESLPPINCIENELITQEKSTTQLRNIKLDPDVDSNDIVIRDNTITSFYEIVKNNKIKQEEAYLAEYMEFFENSDNPNDSSEKSNRSDINSLSSTTDEIDAMSTLSSNSLEEFSQTCHRRQTQSDSIEDLGPPPAKINKVTGDSLHIRLKREPLEKHNIGNSERLFSTDCVRLATLKHETDNDGENLSTIRDKNSSLQSISSKANKTLTLSRKKVVEINSSKDSRKNPTDKDDIVPPTSLLLRRAHQNMLPNSTNFCDYDEFYDTRASCHSSTSLPNVKNEPFDMFTSGTTNKINREMKQNEKLNQSRALSNSTINKETPIINSTTTSNVMDDDDLVPVQNLLGFYHGPLQSSIKKEMEHDEFYAVSLDETSQLKESIDPIKNDSISLKSDSNVNTGKVTKSYMAEDSDEDVIIISDNIKRPSILANSNNLVLTNLFRPNQIDLVFKYNPISIKTSNPICPYGLSNSYEQLNVDLDSDV